MPSRLQISEVSEQADGLPRLLVTRASASCTGLRDKIVKPQATKHHSSRVCRKLRETIILTKFYILLVHCVGDFAVAIIVIIWTNKILLVGKNRVERFIVEQPG